MTPKISMPPLPPVQPLPEAPSTEVSQEEKNRIAAEQAAIERKRKGRKSTILTSPLGVEEEAEVKSDVIELVDLEEQLPTKGKIAFTAPWIEELGLKIGDIVGFKKNRDYRITICDKEYYRTRAEDLLYVEN